MDERKVDVDYEALDRVLGALGTEVANRVSASGPVYSAAPRRRAARNWRRRIRGAVGVGLTWAVLWGLGGGLMWLVRTAADNGLQSLDIALFLGSQYAVVGFLGGVTFSALLRLAEGRRRFDQLRARRFAVWGALGGLLIGGIYAGALMLLFGDGFDAATVQFLAIDALFGAGSAAGSLAIARRADDRRWLERGLETTDGGLTAEERRLPSHKRETED